MDVFQPEKSIGESLKEAAEMVVSQSSFVFDPRTRMYYDNQSGYYYDAVSIESDSFIQLDSWQLLLSDECKFKKRQLAWQSRF